MKSFVAVLIAITFLISGCCGTPTQIPVAIPMAILSLPDLPKLSHEQENMIPDEAYDVLVERDEMLLQHIETINGMIEIHNSIAQ